MTRADSLSGARIFVKKRILIESEFSALEKNHPVDCLLLTSDIDICLEVIHLCTRIKTLLEGSSKKAYRII